MMDVETATLPASEMAATLGLTPRRLQQLVADGHVPASDRGRYALAPTVRAYLAFLTADERRATRSAASSHVADLRAREVEERNARRAAAMLREARREVTDTVDLYVGTLKSGLMNIPARVTKEVPLRRRIEAELENAFGAVARRIAADIETEGRP